MFEGKIAMDVNLIFKIAGIGLLSAVTYQVVAKAGREDMASLISLAGIIVVLMMLVKSIAELLSSIRTLFGI